MFFTLLPWLLSALTFITMYLAGNKDIRGWYIGLFAQIFWLVFDIHAGAWGLIPVCLGLSVIYVQNIYKWRR